MAEKQSSPAKVRVRVGMTGTKIRGPNDPDVFAGRVPLGHRDESFTVQKPTIQEVTYDEAVRRFGKDVADGLFSGVKEDENG